MSLKSFVHAGPAKTFFERVSFANWLVCCVALNARMVLFVRVPRLPRVAAVIGWPFLVDMMTVAVMGALCGAVLSCVSLVLMQNRGLPVRRSSTLLLLNCLLIPYAVLLALVVPDLILGHQLDFD